MQSEYIWHVHKNDVQNFEMGIPYQWPKKGAVVKNWENTQNEMHIVRTHEINANFGVMTKGFVWPENRIVCVVFLSKKSERVRGHFFTHLFTFS